MFVYLLIFVSDLANRAKNCVFAKPCSRHLWCAALTVSLLKYGLLSFSSSVPVPIPWHLPFITWLPCGRDDRLSILCKSLAWTLRQCRSPRIRWVTAAAAGGRHSASSCRAWQMGWHYPPRAHRLLLNYSGHVGWLILLCCFARLGWACSPAHAVATGAEPFLLHADMMAARCHSLPASFKCSACCWALAPASFI